METCWKTQSLGILGLIHEGIHEVPEDIKRKAC